MSMPPAADASSQCQVHASSVRPIKVLHVLGGMDRGGAETWLMHMLRRLNPKCVQFDFLVHTARECAYDAEILATGSRIYRIPGHSNPLQYGRSLTECLRANGPYDVVHSHVHLFSGNVLRIAHKSGVPTLIAHGHSARSSSSADTRIGRRVYGAVAQHWLRRYATHKIAVSPAAAAHLYGAKWSSDRTLAVAPCAIDLNPFGKQVDRLAIRAQLGLQDSDFVVGHVGRFDAAKNQAFLLAIHRELLKQNPSSRLLLIGTGPLWHQLRTSAEQTGIADTVRFTGARSDIPELMLGAMDVFVMPSMHEGLGLAAVEAQAAGLPAIVSENMPQEVNVGSGLLRFISLSDSPAHWADAICQHATTYVSQQAALNQVRGSCFDIEVNAARQLAYYGAHSALFPKDSTWSCAFSK